MRKRYLLGAIFFAAIFYLIGRTLSADESKDELMTRLKALRDKKTEMSNVYDAETHKVKVTAEQEMDRLKKEYRIGREACLQEKNNRSGKLLKDYEDRLKPLLREESELVGLIGKDAGSDFARTGKKKDLSRQAEGP